MASYVNLTDALDIRQAFRNLETTVEAVFWDVEWIAWSKARLILGPTSSWDTGTLAESWVAVLTGTGRLKENGLSGPETSKDVIYVDSPYRMRVHADLGLDSTMWITIGPRLFKVESYKPRDGERTHANVYLREVWETVVPPVPAP